MKTFTSFVIGAALLFGALAAQADEQDPHCGLFRVYTGEGRVEVVAAVPGEINIGDRRIGDFELIDADGNRVGDLHFLSTVMGMDGDLYRLIGQSSYSFNNGQVHHPISYLFQDPSTDVISQGIDEIVFQASSGTGDFAGASGTVMLTRHADGTQSRTLDLTCPS